MRRATTASRKVHAEVNLIERHKGQSRGAPSEAGLLKATSCAARQARGEVVSFHPKQGTSFPPAFVAVDADRARVHAEVVGALKESFLKSFGEVDRGVPFLAGEFHRVGNGEPAVASGESAPCTSVEVLGCPSKDRREEGVHQGILERLV